MTVNSMECPKCGAPIPIEVGAQKTHCAFCGTSLDVGGMSPAQPPLDDHADAQAEAARVEAEVEARVRAQEEGYRRGMAETGLRVLQNGLQLEATMAARRGAPRPVARTRRRHHLFFWAIVVLGAAFFFTPPSRLPAQWQAWRAQTLQWARTTLPGIAGPLLRSAANHLESASAQPARLYSDEFFAQDTVAHIRLTVLSPTGAPWNDVAGRTVSVVERQDPGGAWRAVSSWARVPNGQVSWSVVRPDYGSGPFRWAIYSGGAPLGVSRPFRLPTADGHMTDVVVTLARLP